MFPLQREDECENFISFFTNPYFPSPPLLFVCGPAQCGKKLIVSRSLSTLEHITLAHVSVLQGLVNVKLIYQDILNQLVRPDTNLQSLADLIESCCTKNEFNDCSNFSEFVRTLKKYEDQFEKAVIVLTDCERLSDIQNAQSIIPSLANLRKLCGIQSLSVVMISKHDWHYFNHPDFVAANPVHFNLKPYTRQQLIKIVQSEVAENIPSYSSNSSYNEDFFSNYASIIVGTFFNSCRLLPDLLHLAFKHLPSYIKPVEEERVNENNVRALYRNIDSDLKHSLSNLNMHDQVGKLVKSVNSQQVTPFVASSYASSTAMTPTRNSTFVSPLVKQLESSLSLGSKNLSTPVRRVLGEECLNSPQSIRKLAVRNLQASCKQQAANSVISSPKIKRKLCMNNQLVSSLPNSVNTSQFNSPTKSSFNEGKPVVDYELTPLQNSAESEFIPLDGLQQKMLSSKFLFTKLHVELPFCSKYLLIAAHLASHNPPHTDKRFFTVNHACSSTRVVRKSKASMKAKERILQAQAISGPKTFSLDRLLSIFYAISNDDLLDSASSTICASSLILIQLNSLVTINLLLVVSASTEGALDNIKYKLNVPFPVIHSLAKQVDLDLRRYLYV